MSEAYTKSGVDIGHATQLLKGAATTIESTHDKRVLPTLGRFAALYEVPPELESPIMVCATDGVGTKLKVALLLGKHDTVGIDLVAMNVNDIICHGAFPSAFLDYIALSDFEDGVYQSLLAGVAEGCRIAGCSLVGGETAQMPGFYTDGKYDIAGFCVGFVERQGIIDGQTIAAGDVVLGLHSSGLHSNGYSLARKIFLEEKKWTLEDSRLGRSLGEILLEPTRIYCRSVLASIQQGEVHGLAHITGGGVYENLSRILPQHLAAVVHKSAYPKDALWTLLAEDSGLSEEDFFTTFNAGIGFMMVVPPSAAKEIQSCLEANGETVSVVGEIVAKETLDCEGTPWSVKVC